MARLRVVPPVVPAVTRWRLLVDGADVAPGRWADVDAGPHDIQLGVIALAGGVIVSGTCRCVITAPASSDVDVSFPALAFPLTGHSQQP